MDESSRPLKIFLVENHQDTLTYLRKYLEQKGHVVSMARDMQSALETLPQTPTDVLICDIGLPDGDGWELMRQIDEEARPPYAIAMSGYGTASECDKSLSVGYRHHLVKPFVPEELDQLLQKAAKIV